MKKLKEKFSNLKDKKKLLTLFAIGSILLLTTAATYAFFTYSREGLKENTIESGSIKFHYQEGSRTLSIQDAMPMPDANGKAQTEYFDFTITSKTTDSVRIPYYVTVKRKGNDNSLDSAVKFYLTEVSNKGEQSESEDALTLDTGNQVSKFSELAAYVNSSLNITAAKNEKVLYRDVVPTNSSNYKKDYRLRMWLSDTAGDVTYSQTVTGTCSDPTYTTEEACVAAHKDWTDVATSTEKTFTVTVNVYGFANEANDNANINSITVGSNTLTATSTNTYETAVPSGTTSTTVNVETESDNATVAITKTQSDYTTPIAMNNNSSIQRLSAIKSSTVNLTEGNNYFKIVVTSEDTTNNKELHLKISVPFNLSNQIKLDNTLRTEIPNFSKNEPAIVFTDTNFNRAVANANMTNYQSNYITYASSYTFNPTTGKFTLVNPQVCQYSSCYETLKNKYAVNYLGSANATAATSSDRNSIVKITDTTLDTIYYITSTRTNNYDNSLSGLYKMSVTNGFGGANGDTYYFRGDVTNNYVKFATSNNEMYYGYPNSSMTSIYQAYDSLSECQNSTSFNYNCTKVHGVGEPMVWRIMRINEDGTVRLILDDSIDSTYYAFNASNYGDYSYIYYSNSEIKSDVETWFNNTIIGDNLTKVATGNYFCEAAKTKYIDQNNATVTSGSAVMTVYTSYTPNLKCETDGNGKGLLNMSVGLINYDEAAIAGLTNEINGGHYLYKYYDLWTMSPAGFSSSTARVWHLFEGGYLNSSIIFYGSRIRPVINLKANVTATGTGTSDDPYVVQ